MTPENAAQLLRAGRVVAIPTETVYGLAALATDEAAIHEIFRIKGRPPDNPLIVHVTKEQVDDIAEVSPLARRLIERYWPGPLTLVLPAKEVVPLSARAGLPTVAVRMPSHELTLAVLQMTGPLVAPSANPSGRPSPVTAAHVRLHVPVLDGGPCRVGLESTIIQVAPPRLLRPGAITLEELQEFAPFTTSDAAIAPGMRHRHYSPRTRLVAFEDDAALRAALEEGVAVLTFGAEYPAPMIHARPETLFTALHEIDKGEWKAVYVHLPKAEGIWRAVRNRLEKAAHAIEGRTA